MNPLKYHRVKQGLTLKQLSEKSGLHYLTIQRLEDGQRKASLATIGRLAHALGLEITELSSIAEKPIDDNLPNFKAAQLAVA